MTKRQKAITEALAQLEAQREVQRFYVELGQALPALPACEVLALGDRLMELVAWLPLRQRQKEAYEELMRSLNELVVPRGWVVDVKAMQPQSISKWGEAPRLPIPIPELLP